MQVTRWDALIDRTRHDDLLFYSLTPEFLQVQRQIKQAIAATVWPPDSSSFTIYPESGKRRGEGNGMKPIKEGFVSALAGMGWRLEVRAPARTSFEDGTKGSRPGAFDCHYSFPDAASKPFVVEWETGNISSSHRAINRMALGILSNYISGGVLVVPSRELAQFLTDRVGNQPELEPYYQLWKEWTLAEDAYLGIVTVEHDQTSMNVPRIPKGNDGRALN
ncbi:MAG: hypothetical protein LBN10_04340 [Propionibacteriaceae bacterium]|nr:hypothetical protein [Propionibacteriaceae bacterium]